MRKLNFAQQLSAAARFSASPDTCAMYSVQATTPQLTRNPEQEEAMPSKCPQVPATAVEARASATLSEIVQKAANPASVHNATNPCSACAASCHVCDAVQVSPSAGDMGSIPSVAPSSIYNTPFTPRSPCVSASHLLSVHEVPASIHDTASPLRKVRDTIGIPVNIPHSTRDTSRVPPSVRFSVPKHSQLALQVPHTPNAIRSQPRWPRSRPSCCTPVRKRPQTLHPPASFHTPFPHFTQLANTHDELHATQPSSDEQPANRRRATAPQLLIRPRKPPDMVRQACAMPARF